MNTAPSIAPWRKFVVANWKMNAPAIDEFDAIAAAAESLGPSDVAICPPSLLLPELRRRNRGFVTLGGQDCHAKATGAHTGDISAEMLAAAGARCVIVGHSERRADHGETNIDVRIKVSAAWRAGLQAILCIGESREDRDSGRALAVIRAQLHDSTPDEPESTPINKELEEQNISAFQSDALAIAYEPIWAIGSGVTPTNDEIAEAHAMMRSELDRRFGTSGRSIRLLYGGSVKPANAAEIFAIEDVDGALVGGASLSARDFTPIIAAANAASKHAGAR